MLSLLTFGQAHSHIIGDKFFDKDCIALIESDGADQAREIAFDYFDNKWCFIYHDNHAESFRKTLENIEKHFPRGIVNLNVTDAIVVHILAQNDSLRGTIYELEQIMDARTSI